MRISDWSSDVCSSDLGDICTAVKLRLSNGRTAFLKTLTQAPDGFFAAEAAGLRWLAEVEDGVATPDLLGVDVDCLILGWVESGRPGPDAAAAFGRSEEQTSELPSLMRISYAVFCLKQK